MNDKSSFPKSYVQYLKDLGWQGVWREHKAYVIIATVALLSFAHSAVKRQMTCTTPETTCLRSHKGGDNCVVSYYDQNGAMMPVFGNCPDVCEKSEPNPAFKLDPKCNVPKVANTK